MTSPARNSQARDVLYLPATGLLSKWGFDDGDIPDGFLTWCEEQGINHDSLDWHPVLRRLVREHLLPVLQDEPPGQQVRVEEFATAHNPIRAVLDDQDVSAWSGLGVEVPYRVVAQAAGLMPAVD